MGEQDLVFRVWRGMVKLQRKTRLLSLSLAQVEEANQAANLGIAEALILLLTESIPRHGIKELARDLRLERSWVSRIVSGLSKNGLIETQLSDTDSRSTLVKITAAGLAELTKILTFRSLVTDTVLEPLSVPEQNELRILMHLLADGLNTPRISRSPGGHPLDIEMARISCRLGVVGDNFLGSGVNVNKYQFLFELAERDGKPCSVQELAALLPIDSSSVSRLVASNEREGLLDRNQDSADARVSLVAISEKGRQWWKKASATALDLYTQGLARLTTAEQEKLADFLGRLAHTSRSRTVRVLGKKIEGREISFGQARQFFEHKHRVELNADLIEGEKSVRAVGCFEEGNLRAVAIVKVNQDAANRSLLIASDLNPEHAAQAVNLALLLAE